MFAGTDTRQTTLIAPTAGCWRLAVLETVARQVKQQLVGSLKVTPYRICFGRSFPAFFLVLETLSYGWQVRATEAGADAE